SGPSSAPPSPERTPPSAPVQVDRSGVPILPDPKLTPGAALPVTTDDICVPGYTQAVRDVPSSVKRQVYEEYGITTHEPGEYEVDHLISLELGGSNSIRNLWPQSYRTQPWNAHVKDALENELHERVCSGQLDLKTAQREISGNWIESYKKYFHTDRPLSSGRPRRRRNAPEAIPVETVPRTAAPIAPGSTRDSEGAATAPSEVWVNTRSGKYFHPGSRY